MSPGQVSASSFSYQTEFKETHALLRKTNSKHVKKFVSPLGKTVSSNVQYSRFAVIIVVGNIDGPCVYKYGSFAW